MSFHVPYPIKHQPRIRPIYGFRFVRYFLNALAFIVATLILTGLIALALTAHFYS